MMVLFEFDRSFIWLLVVSRMMIGIGFVGVSIELAIIVRFLQRDLLFRRTLTMFAAAIGACGVSRVVDGCFLFSMMGPPVVSHEVVIWVFDSVSAVMSIAALLIMLPLVWNAMGGHFKLKTL